MRKACGKINAQPAVCGRDLRKWPIRGIFHQFYFVLQLKKPVTLKSTAKCDGSHQNYSVILGPIVSETWHAVAGEDSLQGIDPAEQCDDFSQRIDGWFRSRGTIQNRKG